MFGCWVIVPGHDETLIAEAFDSEARVVFLDLEDHVPKTEKDAAREAVADLDFTGRSKSSVVRVNPLDTERGLRDVERILTAAEPPDAILLPKVRTGRDVQLADDLLTAAGSDVGIAANLETPQSFLNAAEIATASPRIVAFQLGHGDLTVELKINRLDVGADYQAQNRILHFPRSIASMMGAVAGVPVIDAGYSAGHAGEDLDGLKETSRAALELGLDGKLAHLVPEEISTINEVFLPSEAMIERARRLIDAWNRADIGGDFTMEFDGIQVGRNHVRNQLHVLERADEMGYDVGTALDDVTIG
jgi:citrate lyase beta subunit